MTNEPIFNQDVLIPSGSTGNDQFYVNIPGETHHGKKYSLILWNETLNPSEIAYDYRINEKFGDDYYSVEGGESVLDSGAMIAIPIGILRDRLSIRISPTGNVANDFTVKIRLREA